MNEKVKLFIWALVPFVYGYICNTYIIILNPFVIQIIFAIFWGWVGVKTFNLSGSKIKNFLIVNSVWLISFLLFIWQFVIVSDEGRNFTLAGISQHYMLSFLWSGANIPRLYTNTFHGTNIMIIAYVAMLVVFTIGFSVSKVRSAQR